MTKPTTETVESALRQAQLEQVQLANEKLKHELAELKKVKPWHLTLAQYVPLITALIAVAGFMWGLIQYQDQQTKNRAAQEKQTQRDAQLAEQALMKPWLDNQRTIYLQALEASATIATTNDPKLQQQATEEFWKLYNGKMILVETTDVSTKMVEFGNCLNGVEKCNNSQLVNRSRNLATAMTESMSATAQMTYTEFAAKQFKYK